MAVPFKEEGAVAEGLERDKVAGFSGVSAD